MLLGASLLASSWSVAQQAPYYEEKTFAVGSYAAAEPSKLWVNIERLKFAGPIRLAVLDARGRELFSEVLPKRELRFRQKFDFSTMTDGTYTLVISDGHQTQEQSFRLSTPGLEQQLPQRLITLREARTSTESRM